MRAKGDINSFQILEKSGREKYASNFLYRCTQLLQVVNKSFLDSGASCPLCAEVQAEAEIASLRLPPLSRGREEQAAAPPSPGGEEWALTPRVLEPRAGGRQGKGRGPAPGAEHPSQGLVQDFRTETPSWAFSPGASGERTPVLPRPAPGPRPADVALA